METSPDKIKVVVIGNGNAELYMNGVINSLKYSSGVVSLRVKLCAPFLPNDRYQTRNEWLLTETDLCSASGLCIMSQNWLLMLQ